MAVVYQNPKKAKTASELLSMLDKSLDGPTLPPQPGKEHYHCIEFPIALVEDGVVKGCRPVVVPCFEVLNLIVKYGKAPHSKVDASRDVREGDLISLGDGNLYTIKESGYHVQMMPPAIEKMLMGEMPEEPQDATPEDTDEIKLD